MRLLLVNGNRTQAVTDCAVAEAQRAAGAGTEIIGATATFGADIVSTVADNTVAAHAVLDTLARYTEGVDAAILAISLDSGLAAARQLLPFPVLGITEAGLHTACLLGERVGMITFGEQTTPLYTELIARYGLQSRLAGHRVIGTPSRLSYLEPAPLQPRILEAADSLIHEAGAQAVLLCGAALAGVARQLQTRVSVPLLDGVACAVRLAETLVRGGYPGTHARPPRHPAAPDMQGIDPRLAALFRNV